MRDLPNNQRLSNWPIRIAVLRDVPVALDPDVTRRHLYCRHGVWRFRPDDISFQPDNPLDHPGLWVERAPAIITMRSAKTLKYIQRREVVSRDHHCLPEYHNHAPGQFVVRIVLPGPHTVPSQRPVLVRVQERIHGRPVNSCDFEEVIVGQNCDGQPRCEDEEVPAELAEPANPRVRPELEPL